MIRINLLPAERRKREARPLPRMTGLVAAALLLAATAGTALWALKEADSLRGQVEQRDKDIAKARKSTAELVRIEAELAPLRRQAEIAARVERARRGAWARRLDRVAAILDGQASRVWLTSARGTQRTGPAAGGPEATFELACEAAADPSKPAPMGQVTGEFVEALRKAFIGSDGDFTRYDDRYAEQATTRPGTVEGWSEAFIVRLFRDRAVQEGSR
jgi:hypothetical protein